MQWMLELSLVIEITNTWVGYTKICAGQFCQVE